MYKMIFLVNQKTNWDFPAKKKILDHYKKPRINLKRTIAVLGKLGGFTLTMWDVKSKWTSETLTSTAEFYLNYVGCKGFVIGSSGGSGTVLP